MGQHSGVSSESKAWLSVGTSMALAPECGLTFLWNVLTVSMYVYANPYLSPVGLNLIITATGSFVLNVNNMIGV